MYRTVLPFDLRSAPNDAAQRGPEIDAAWDIDIVGDAENGWVKIKAYLQPDTKEGFAKRNWLDETTIDPNIDRDAFINECLDAAQRPESRTSSAYLIAVAQIESGIRNVGSSNSGAFGPFQILPDTWLQYIASPPPLSLTEADRYNPYEQPKVAARIAATGTAALKPVLGNDPTPSQLYFSHFFGVEAAKVILAPAMSTKNIRDALAVVYPPPSTQVDKIMDANKERFSKNGAPLLVSEILEQIAVDLGAAIDIALPLPPGAPNAALPALPANVDTAMLAMAKTCNGTLDTGSVPGTNGGRLACAWAINEVARQALGRPIGGGLSTNSLFQILQSRHTPVKEPGLVGGAIVISPSLGSVSGHVGIVGDIAADIESVTIYSNSSSKHKFDNYYNIAKWKAYFTGQLRLPVFFFRLNPAHL